METDGFSPGFISSVFDNIPPTKLAPEQGGYDWVMLVGGIHKGQNLKFGNI